MPLYSFKDLNTGEVFEKIMSWKDRVEFLEFNTHIAPQITPPDIIAGRSMESGRLPDGLKDKFREMKKKYPTARGVDHLI